MPNKGGPNFKQFAVFVFVASLELAMLALLTATYTETMGLMSDQYLCDMPGFGGLFCIIDQDMTVSHLLAFLLAVFSVAVPIMIWSVVLDENIQADPRAWLASPMNRVKAGMAGLVYVAVIALEVVNLYTLIAQQAVTGPFGGQQDEPPLMDFLAQNQGLGIFVALLIALVNAVLALMTVRATRSLMKD